MQDKLQHWVEGQLSALHLPRNGTLTLKAVSGDAGFRSYFRLNTAEPLLAVDAPPATENNDAFVDIAAKLRSCGVRAPRVYAWDREQGFLLIEDLGSELYLPHLSDSSADRLYGQALEALLKFQLSPEAPTLPAYDRQRLMAEMELLREWFVPKLLGVALGAAQHAMLDRLFERLVDSALQQPQVLVHRDYHSRNLLVGEQGPGIIDFQDGVCGALTYDLVSLLRDCYVRWPEARVEQWALTYREQAVAKGLLDASVSEAQFLRWFDLMGLQRHIKVLGIFARLWLRDGKAAYLHDLPLVMRYTLEVARRYPECDDFVRCFEQQWLPAAQQCHWYRPWETAGERPAEAGL